MAKVIRQQTCYRERRTGFGIVEFQAPVVQCDCGREVVCERFTNTCECGADYGPSGSRLAPREQWGEETGESWIDIINLPY